VISFSALAFLGIYLGAFQRLLDEIAADLSLTKVVMGFIVTAHFIGFFTGPFIAGELSDKYGRKIIILSSLLTFLAGLIFILVSFNISMLVAGVFLIGAGFGTTEGSITTLLTDAEPQDSNRIINVSQVFFGLGAAAGPFIAMAFIALIAEWKYFYCISIVIIALLIIMFTKYPYPPQIACDKIDGIISIKLLRKKAFIILFLSMFMYVGIEEGVAFWITSYVKEWSAKEYYPSLILTAFWGSVMIGRCLVSRFSKGLNKLLVISSALTVIFLAIIVFFKKPTYNNRLFFWTRT
jgi:fucose permease